MIDAIKFQKSLKKIGKDSMLVPGTVYDNVPKNTTPCYLSIRCTES